MKVSDLIATFLSQENIKLVFGVTGGASLHLLSSFSQNKNIRVIYNHHEQGSSFSADAVWRLSREIGVAVATSGPGAMNLIPGIGSSFFDSIPSLFLTGQVATFRNSEGMGIRQYGFQETDIVQMVTPITKYACKIVNYHDILFQLKKALTIAKAGRMGPVLIDIPDDIQRMELNEDQIEHCWKKINKNCKSPIKTISKLNLIPFFNEIIKSCRPLAIIGFGADGCTDEISRILCQLKIPIIPTWAVADRFSSDDENIVGTAGTHGNRYSNYAIQNADLIISIGCRLDSHMIGSPPSEFAPNAKKIIVDIDRNELNKFEIQGMMTTLLIEASAKDFIQNLEETIKNFEVKKINKRFYKWKCLIKELKKELNDEDIRLQTSLATNPYYFIDKLSDLIKPNTNIMCDTGCILAWSLQRMRFKRSIRLIHAFNNTPMGFSIPAAISAGIIHTKSKVLCLVGDGSFMMNIQELATLRKIDNPAKIFVINNQGYSMIRQTQEVWFKSDYFGSSEADLTFPDYKKISESFGYKYRKIANNKEVEIEVKKTLDSKEHVICEVEISPDFRVIPQLKYGAKLDDMEPPVSSRLKKKYNL